jgi:hypothetical protein
VYKADATSVATLATDTIVTTGIPGPVGNAGATGTSNAAPPGNGGASRPCSPGCGSSSSVPVVFPAYALVIRGDELTMEVACTTTCTASGSLRHRLAATSSSPAVLANFRFHISGRGVARVTATLTAAGHRLLAGRERIGVGATIAVKIPGASTATYVGTVEISRSVPRARHRPAPRRVARLRVR